MAVAGKALICILWQVGIALVSYITISIVMLVLYDSRGYRRGRK